MTLQCPANFLHFLQSESIGSPDGDPISVDRRGWGFPASPQGRRPEDIGRRAEEQKPSFLALARKMMSSELRAKRSAHGGRSERRELWEAPEDM